MLVGLLEELLDEMENDESFRAMYEANDELQASLSWFYSRTSYDDMIRELRRGLRDFERDLSGEITISFYIGSGDRLLRLEIDAQFEHEEDDINFDISLDFGASAHDLWVFEMNLYNDSERSLYILEWDINETPHGGETTLRAVSEDRWGSEDSTLILDWTDSGIFSLSVVDDFGINEMLSGIYTKTEDGFDFGIDNPLESSFWNQSLTLDISAVRRSGHIEDITFINVSEWNQVLLEKIVGLFVFW